MKPPEVGVAKQPADMLTLIGVGVITYSLATVLHEGVGHAGACILVGGHPLAVSTVHMECSSGHRLVIAGGTLMNIAAGGLFLALGRVGSLSPIWKYFLWLSMTVNLLMAAGYFAFSGIGGVGDWAMFVQGFEPAWVWRVVMAVFGAAAYLGVVRLSLNEMASMIGEGETQRQARAVRLAQPPYFAGGILACIAGSLNPHGMVLVAMSAAASTFGGTSALVWMDSWLRRFDIQSSNDTGPLTIQRSWPWIIMAAVVGTVFIVVLGPGVRFGIGVSR